MRFEPGSGLDEADFGGSDEGIAISFWLLLIVLYSQRPVLITSGILNWYRPGLCAIRIARSQWTQPALFPSLAGKKSLTSRFRETESSPKPPSPSTSKAALKAKPP